MIAGQRLIASDGYEIALFPMPYLQMSQDEGGDYSHLYTYNIDLLGWDENGRVYQAPIYAPVTMKVVDYRSGTAWGNECVFESIERVHLPDGSLDYLTIAFAHDSNPPFTSLGAIVTQGQLCYHTGTYGNVSGDHTHTCVGKGHYQGFTNRENSGNYDLTNRIHYWEGVFVNDTVIINGFGHDWIKWTDPVIPVIKKGRFPWFLIAQKKRNKPLQF